MIKKIMEKIPSKNVGYMIICGGIILLIILLGILPLHRYNVKRSEAVAGIQAQIDEQKELRQIYQLISQASLKKDDRILPNPMKTKLSRQNMDEYININISDTPEMKGVFSRVKIGSEMPR